MKVKKNKIFKVGLLILLLFTLTGCTSSYFGYYQLGAGFFDLDVGKYIGSSIMSLQLSIFEMFNSFFLGFNNVVLEAFKEGPMKIVEAVYDILSDFGFLTNTMSIISFIGVAAILGRFIFVIFKTHFLNEGGEHSMPSSDLIRRVVYSMIMLLIAPSIIITAFVGTNLLAASVGTSILDTTADSNENEIYQYYEDTQKYPGLSLNTYCYSGLESSGTSKGYESLKNNDYSSEITILGSSTAGLPKGISESEMNSLNSKYCKDGAQRVGEYLLYKTSDAQYWPYKSFGGSTIGDGVSESAASVLENLLCMLIGAIITLAITLQTCFRIAELCSSLIMLWYYVSVYINEIKNNALGDFLKTIGTTCLTQFFTIVMYCFYLAYNVSSTAGLNQFFVSVAFLIIIFKGSSTIRAILNPSGAGSAAMSASKTAGKVLSKL